MSKEGKDLKSFDEERSKARYDENRSLNQSLHDTRQNLAAETEKRTAAEEQVAILEKEVGLLGADFSARPDWSKKPVKDSKENKGTLVAMLSDTHYGEVVNPREMGGYNKYDLKVAEKRTERFFRRTILLGRNFMAGVKYDGIYLALNGDIVSGDIHEELVETNEATTYETILWAVPKLAAGIEMWAEEFGKVHVVSAPGNHGRNSIKPRHKKRSANNADTLIAKLVAKELSGDDRITFDIPESSDVDFMIYGSRFTMEHGDNLKFNGTAEIGALGPMKRGTLRTMAAKQAEGKPFDYMLISHFHQYIPAETQGFVSNGSLKGYDEYARNGKFKPEQPKQALFVVTPEYGITTQMPVFVGDRNEKW